MLDGTRCEVTWCNVFVSWNAAHLGELFAQASVMLLSHDVVSGRVVECHPTVWDRLHAIRDHQKL